VRVRTSQDLPADPAAGRLVRRVLADDVFDALTGLVMDHVVAPGERMSIDGLALRLGVSPTPVREALARLEALGLARKEPLRGYRATPLLTRAELDDLFEFRLALEPWAARRAAHAVRDSDADPHVLSGLLAEMTEAPAEGWERYRALAEHDRRFHDAVLVLAGNAHARRALAQTHCHLHIFRLYYVEQVGTSALAEHEVVADAVTAGDARAAERAMRVHLTASRDRLRPAASAS
jgi:DNA-binding GntR family transcriptional regulator